MSAQGGADQRCKEVRWSCGEIRWSYEVLLVSIRVEICNSAKRASGKFHGNPSVAEKISYAAVERL
jgi:hypothetical protein